MVDVLIAGVGMTPFVPLGSGASAGALARQATRAALEDARIDYDLVDQVFTACVQGEAGSGEQALASMGLSGIAVFKVGDGCTAGTDALQMARNSVLSGEAECALALGFECMPAGISSCAFFGLSEHPGEDWDNLAHSRDPLALLARRQHPAALYAAQASWLLTHLAVAEASFERVLSQAWAQTKLNPYALLKRTSERDGWLAPYLAPPACGAAAVLVCSREFALRYGVRGGVVVLASARGSDMASELESASVLDVLGRAATRRVARQAYEQAGVGADEIELVELHDQSVGDFMVYSSALGFCQESELNDFVRQRRNLRGAPLALCPSGGLLGRGHAPGATGLAQIAELVWQLRGEAKARQVPGARTALQHSAALGRAVSVTILQRI